MEKELNIFDFFKLIYKYKIILISWVVTLLLITAIYNQFSEKLYLVRTTFILSPDLDSGSKNILGSYSSLLSAGGKKEQIKDYLYIMINSNLMRERITNKFVKIFNKSGEDISNLKLKKNLILKMKKYQVFNLSYHYKDSDIAYQVVNECMNALNIINQDLNLSGSKNIITVIDHPKVPELPFKPNKIINNFLGIFSGLFFGVTNILIICAIKNDS